jgi:hypothetical protein
MWGSPDYLALQYAGTATLRQKLASDYKIAKGTQASDDLDLSVWRKLMIVAPGRINMIVATTMSLRSLLARPEIAGR